MLPHRIVLTGFMGAGKSTIGPLLAARLGWHFVDLDDEIVRAQSASIADLFARLGEAAFREHEHTALKNVLHRPQLVLAIGGGAIETPANFALLTSDPATLLVYLEVPFEHLVERCERQPNAAVRPVLNNRPELAERFLRRQPLYEAAHWTIATKDIGPEQVVEAIVQRWNSAVSDKELPMGRSACR